jgi:hypothetical protein
VAAVSYYVTDPWVGEHPTGRDLPDQRDARVYRLGTAAHRPEARVYRRRRAVALMALVIAALMVVIGVRLALGGSGGGALTASGSAGAGAPSAGRAYVVHPGDSLWSIVQATRPSGDPRPEVDRLAAQLDGRPLQPGQVLQLPGRD